MHRLPIDKGAIIGFTIIFLWLGTLLALLNLPVAWNNPLTYFFIFLQTHLYTGLFITSHDAMHGVASHNRKLNNFIGKLAAGMFAFNDYNRLFPRHHAHHRHTATNEDPDFYEGNFVSWYYSFLKEYITLKQFLLMAITFQILIFIFPVANVVLYFIIPSLLSTLQLFYFGTYLPHKGDHPNKYKSGSQSHNHFWAFISCYFFGYHYEHHHKPGVPWWQLYKEKEKFEGKKLI